VSLEVQILETQDAIEAIEPAWRDLWERDPAATPFQSPDWLVPWMLHLWGGGTLRVLAMRDGGRLVAVVPLFLWGYGSQPRIVRVSLLGAGISDYLGMTADPEFADAAARSLYEWLADTTDEWNACDLEELRPGSALLGAQPPETFAVDHSPCSVCPVLTLPRDFDTLYESLDGRFRRNLRTAEHRLAGAGTSEIVQAARDCSELMDALFRLHSTRWRERGESGMLSAAALLRFHRETAERMFRCGTLRLAGLRLDGEIIAVQYNIFAKGCCYYYLSGFDPAYGRYSPGALLIAATIRQAFEEGARELDFLRNGEGFKYQWGARDRANRKLLITRAAACGRKIA
jgi:CelD/BcsL family acetyltransferase involved in cellulose biosynthesis